MSAPASHSVPSPTPATPSLEITSLTGEVMQFPLTQRHVLVGRGAEATLKLESGTVSRKHAELSLDPHGRWWVRDLGSRNGVRFGGQKVSERVLYPGAAFQLGQYRVVFRAPAGWSIRDAETTAATTSLPLNDDSAGQISTLDQAEHPRISGEHLSILMNFGRELLDVEQPDDRMEALCKLMVRNDFFHGASAMIFRVAIDTDENAVILCGCGDRFSSINPPYISRRLVHHLRTQGRPVLASNVSRIPDAIEMSISPDIASLSAVACPIGSDDSGRAMDVLYVTLPHRYGTTEWLVVATLAAEQYRNADSAWAARNYTARQAALERELQQARQIQFSTVPKPLSVPGLDVVVSYEPCHWVGGDYVDVAPTRDGNILLTIADVCGKGMPAALITMSLRTMTRTGVQAMQGDFGLAELFDAMRPQLADCLQEDSFVTMAGVLVDPQTGTIRCVNAGHPPPLIVSPDGRVRKLPCAENFPLGVMSEAMHCRDESLHPGELLVMFTDGISELPIGEDLMGVDRFADAVANLYATNPARPTSEIAGKISQMLAGYRSTQSADDDQTFLLAKRPV